MNRAEFLNQLEYLLQDIPEEEKRDAIDYYGDYLEEAGPKNEAQVLNEFGSPERIASIIRTDLLGVMNEGGEFTENGYEDQRFERHSLPVVKTEERSKRRYGEPGTPYEKGSYAKRRQAEDSKKKEHKWGKFALIILIALIASPFLLAGVMGVFGSTVGIAAVLVAIVFALIILTLTAFVGGIALLIYGLTHLVVDLWFGLLNVGLGLAFIGGGFLLFVCAFLFYGKFLPWAVRGLIQIGRNVFGGGPKKKADKTGGESRENGVES